MIKNLRGFLGLILSLTTIMTMNSTVLAAADS